MLLLYWLDYWLYNFIVGYIRFLLCWMYCVFWLLVLGYWLYWVFLFLMIVIGIVVCIVGNCGLFYMLIMDDWYCFWLFKLVLLSYFCDRKRGLFVICVVLLLLFLLLLGVENWLFSKLDWIFLFMFVVVVMLWW